MSTAWTTPKTWTASVVTVADLNTHIRDNELHLYENKGYCRLLKSNSGTDASAGATNVDTYALASSLAAKDLLKVIVQYSTLTQGVASLNLYNQTDALNILGANNAGAISAGYYGLLIATIGADQSALTAITAMGQDGVKNDTTQSTTSAADAFKNSTFTTNWTGAWTLALRHGGVTAGGTLRWKWSIYKLAAS